MTMHFPDHFWPVLIIPLYYIILIKIPTLENISSKHEMINVRVHGTDDITENFVKECLIKVQTFFESICGKSQLDG